MSRNGSGVYSLPAGNPVVTGTTISSSWANTTLSDIATALTGSLAADGQTAMTGNLQMGNNKVTGLAVASATGDALSFGQAATISALTVTGAFAANGGATLGDASGDALTINSSAVSIPNGLNFGSNNLVLSGGNVGIGTSSPSFALDISQAAPRIRQVATTGTNSVLLQLVSTGGTAYVGLDNSSGGLGGAYSLNLYHGGAYPILFSTNGTERMRIDSSGNLLVGTTSFGGTGGWTFYPTGSGSSPYVVINKTNTASTRAFDFQVSGTSAGSINWTNTATSYVTSSDYRLKDITGALTGYKERVMALQPKQGSWKSDGSEFRGFLAHEFASQYPTAVSGEKDAVDAEGKPQYQGMQAGGSETIADLVALAQEQQAIITDLTNRLTALENK